MRRRGGGRSSRGGIHRRNKPGFNISGAAVASPIASTGRFQPTLAARRTKIRRPGKLTSPSGVHGATTRGQSSANANAFTCPEGRRSGGRGCESTNRCGAACRLLMRSRRRTLRDRSQRFETVEHYGDRGRAGQDPGLWRGEID
jgi:hypothetical protein